MHADVRSSAHLSRGRLGPRRREALYATGLAALLASSTAWAGRTIGFLIGWRAVQGSAAAVVLSAPRQVGGTLAVAVFGALIAQRASFLPGMRASLLIALVVLFAATAASFALPRHGSGK